MKDWYKDAVFYEVFVRSFKDGTSDGIGDFIGLRKKLDYIKSLGVTCIWLLPMYPSPLKDDGYDIADFYNIHSDYGKMSDFEAFILAAHKNGIRVVADLVVNHTSNEHFWFKEAVKNPDSKYHNYYVWSNTPEKYRDCRIIFCDTETSNWTYHSKVGKYYWHRFFSHQPDLNYDNIEVQQEILSVVDFWLKKGLDGFRVDAVPYLFEREGTNGENLPETHEFCKKLRQFVDKNYPEAVLLAEANQPPRDVVDYFGNNDQFHMCFNFPLMPMMFMAIRKEDRRPIENLVNGLPDIPDSCQWCIFLRNHDELTLEMVSEKDRRFMYNAYAKDPKMRINIGIRRRLYPLLNKDRRALELLHSLLFTMPGSPVLYYGDEIGMGDNIYLGDRAGVRTPMQWDGSRNAGFSDANPDRLAYPVIRDPAFNYQGINVEEQEKTKSSFLNWIKDSLKIRSRNSTFGRGNIEFLKSENNKVISYLRGYEDTKLFVVNNLSRYSQYVELDLQRFSGWTPIDLFGNIRFPKIGELPYLVTLGPYGYYWFSLEPPKE